MGTRGTLVLKFRGKKYYIHISCDAYCFGAGRDIIKQLIELLNQYTVEEIVEKLSQLKVYHIWEDLTEDEINYINQQNKLHRKWKLIIDMFDRGYIMDDQGCGDDSEYMYVVNFDKQILTDYNRACKLDIPSLKQLRYEWHITRCFDS